VGKTYTINRNTEAVLDTSKEAGLKWIRRKLSMC
jgi:hypothetical protein